MTPLVVDARMQVARVAIHVEALPEYAGVLQSAALLQADELAGALLRRVGALPAGGPVPDFAETELSTLLHVARAHDRCAHGWCDARGVGGDRAAYVPGGGWIDPAPSACGLQPGGVEVYAAFHTVHGAVEPGGAFPESWLVEWRLPSDATVVVRAVCPGGAPRLTIVSNQGTWPESDPGVDAPLVRRRLLSWAAGTTGPVPFARLAAEAARLLRQLVGGVGR